MDRQVQTFTNRSKEVSTFLYLPKFLERLFLSTLWLDPFPSQNTFPKVDCISYLLLMQAHFHQHQEHISVTFFLNKKGYFHPTVQLPNFLQTEPFLWAVAAGTLFKEAENSKYSSCLFTTLFNKQQPPFITRLKRQRLLDQDFKTGVQSFKRWKRGAADPPLADTVMWYHFVHHACIKGNSVLLWNVWVTHCITWQY